jgi:hypothetical protein
MQTVERSVVVKDLGGENDRWTGEAQGKNELIFMIL